MEKIKIYPPADSTRGGNYSGTLKRVRKFVTHTRPNPKTKRSTPKTVSTEGLYLGYVAEGETQISPPSNPHRHKAKGKDGSTL